MATAKEQGEAFARRIVNTESNSYKAGLDFAKQNQALNEQRKEQERNNKIQSLITSANTKTIDADLNKFSTDWSNITGQYQKGNYVNQQTFDDIITRSDDLSRRLGNIKSAYELNGDLENAKKIGDTINNIVGVVSGTNELKGMYGQYSSQAQFENDYDNYTYANKYNGKSYTDILNAIGSTTGREQNWLNANKYNYMNSQEAQNEINSIQKPMADLQAALKKAPLFSKERLLIQNQINELMAQSGGNNATIKALEGIRDNAKRAEEAKKYEDLANAERDDGIFVDLVKNHKISGENILDKYKAEEEKYNKEFKDQNGIDYTTAMKLGSLNGTKTGEWERYNAMTDEQKKTYQRLSQKYGNGFANEYFDAITPELDKKRSEDMTNAVKKLYERSGGWGKEVLNALSVPLNVYGGIASAASDLASAITGNYNPYSTIHQTVDFGNTVRGLVSEEVKANAENLADFVINKTGLNNILGDKGTEKAKNLAGTVRQNTYQAIMSGLDSALGAATLGAAYLYTMGAGAASQKAKEMYEKGASNKQIIESALIAGGAEILTEKLPQEELLKFLNNPMSGKNAVVQLLKNSFFEGAEEVESDFINSMADSFIYGISNKDKLVEQKVKGYTDDEGVWHDPVDRKTAEKEAVGEIASDYWWSFYGGAISSVGGGAVKLIKDMAANYDGIGAAVINQEKMQDVLNIALSEDFKAEVGDIKFESQKARTERQNEATEQIKELAQSIKNDLDAGKKISKHDLGVLTASITPTAQLKTILDIAERTVWGNKKHVVDVLKGDVSNSQIDKLTGKYATSLNELTGLTVPKTNQVSLKRAVVRDASTAVSEVIGDSEIRQSLISISDEQTKNNAIKTIFNKAAAYKAQADALRNEGKADTSEYRVASASFKMTNDMANDLRNGASNPLATSITGKKTVQTDMTAKLAGVIDGVLNKKATGEAKKAELNAIADKFEAATDKLNGAELTEARKEISTIRAIAERATMKPLADSSAANYLDTADNLLARELAKYGITYKSENLNAQNNANNIRGSYANNVITIAKDAETKGIKATVRNLLGKEYNLSAEQCMTFALVHEGAHAAFDSDPQLLLDTLKAMAPTAVGRNLGLANAFASDGIRFENGRVIIDASTLSANGQAFVKAEIEANGNVGNTIDTVGAIEELACNWFGANSATTDKDFITFAKRNTGIISKIKEFIDKIASKLKGNKQAEQSYKSISELYRGALERFGEAKNYDTAVKTAEAIKNSEETEDEELTKDIEEANKAAEEAKAVNETLTENKEKFSMDGNYTVDEENAKYEKIFVDDIKQWEKDKMPDGETFILGYTGNVLQGLGAIENDIYMHGDKIKSILDDHSEMEIDDIKKIPKILNDPVLVLKSRNVRRNGKSNTRLVVFGSASVQDGTPIMSVLDLRPVENGFVIDDMQKVNSAYAKTSSPVTFIRNSEILYTDKKRAIRLLRTIGFQMPIELKQNGFIGIISYSGQKVNISGKSFSDIFSEAVKGKEKLSTATDAEYLKLAEDPKKNEANLREMVEQAAKEAGYSYHLYHGTNADFSVFDVRENGGKHGKGEGYGIYLSSNKTISDAYGDRVIDSYVKFNRLAEGTKKTLSMRELKKIIKATCEQDAKDSVNDGEYETVSDAIKDTWVSNYVYTYEYPNMDNVYSDVAKTIFDGNENDGDIINEVMSASGRHYTYTAAMDFYDKTLTPITGIDGFHYVWGDGADIYLAFRSSQIKQSDPVTYDDNGNVIPLSERFNTANEDIRYSTSTENDAISAIKEKYADDTDRLVINEKGNDITISNMVVKPDKRNKGAGTAILNDIVDYADANGKRILLTPTSEYGTKDRLAKWYKRNGFVENRGRFADLTTYETMIRNPNPAKRVKYSTETLDDGSKVVLIENNVYNQIVGKEHRYIADIIAKHIGEFYNVIADGEKIYIGEDLPGEYTQSEYTKELIKKHRRGVLKAKNQASQNIGEMIEIAYNPKWERNEKSKHDTDAKNGWYIYKTKFAVPKYDTNGKVVGANVYDADLVIRHDADGKKYLYDMQNIKKNSLAHLPQTVIDRIGNSGTSAAGKTVVENSISQPEEKVNTSDENISKKSVSTDYTPEQLAEKNSSAEAYAFYKEFAKERNIDENGYIYEEGKKPTARDYDEYGQLDEKYKGVQRLKPRKNGGYILEKYDGVEWNRVYNEEEAQKKIKELEDKLKATIEEYNGYKGRYLDPKQTSEFVKGLISEWGAEANYNEIRKKFVKAYRYFYFGEVINDKGSVIAKEKMDSVKAYDMITDIATAIYDSATETTAEYDDYKNALEALKGLRITIPDDLKTDVVVALGKDKWRDVYNSALKAGIYLVKEGKGTMIDRAYDELHSIPAISSYLDPTITNPSDQLKELITLSSTLKDALEENTYNKYEGYGEWAEMAQNDPENEMSRDNVLNHIREEIIGGFMTIDRSKSETEKAKETADRETKEQLLADQMYYGEKVARYKRQAQEAVDKFKENMYARVAERDENAAKGIELTDFGKRALAMSKKIASPTKQKHFPDTVKTLAYDLLSGIGYGDKATQHTGEVINKINGNLAKAVIDRQEEIGDEIYDALKADIPAFKESLPKIPETNLIALNKMTSAELHELNTLLKRIDILGNKINKLYTSGIELQNEAYGIITELDSVLKDKKKETPITDFFMYQASDPEGFFTLLGSPTLKKAFRNIVTVGQKNFANTIAKYADRMEKITNGSVPREWHTDEHTFNVNGKEVKFTTAQLMSLYLLSKQNQSKNCIINPKGGISVSSVNRKLDSIKYDKDKKLGENLKEAKVKYGKTLSQETRLTEDQLNHILDEFKKNKEAVKVADEISGLLNGEVKDDGNRTSLEIEGYSKFLTPDYFPMMVSRNSQGNRISYDDAMSNARMFVKQRSFERSRTESTNKQLIVDDIFSVVENHLAGMAQYVGMTAPITDFIRLYDKSYILPNGDKTSASEKTKKISPQAETFVRKFVKSLQGQQMPTYDERLLSEILLSHYKAAAVAGNLSTILKQPTAIFRAMPELSAEAIKEFSNIKTTKADIEEMAKYSGLARMKTYGFSENANAKSFRDLYDANSKDKYHQIMDKLSMPAEAADNVTWAAIWRACKADTTSLEEAGKKFDEIILKTQVVNTATTSVPVAYQGGVAKLIFAFKNEPLKTFNYIRSLIVEANRSKTSASRKKLLMGLSAWAVNTVVTAMITAAFSMIRDDEDDSDKLFESFFEKWASSAKDDIIESSTIFAADIYQAIESAVEQRYNDKSNMAIAAVMDLASGFVNLIKWVGKESNENTKTLYDRIYYLMNGVGEVTGVPVRTFMRYIKSLGGLVANATGSPELKYFHTSIYYNNEGYDSSDAVAQFKSILTDALNDRNYKGFDNVANKLLAKGFSMTKIKNAVAKSEFFDKTSKDYNANVAEALKNSKILTKDLIESASKTNYSSQVTEAYNAFKAGKNYKKLLETDENGNELTDVQKEKLMKDKAEKAIKSDLKTRLEGITKGSPAYDSVIKAIAHEYRNCGFGLEGIRNMA